MQIQVRLFAVARDAAGCESLTVEVLPQATVADVRAALLRQLPSLAPLGTLLMFAVDERYASDTTAVTEASDVACIPPVSGG